MLHEAVAPQRDSVFSCLIRLVELSVGFTEGYVAKKNCEESSATSKQLNDS